MNRWASKRKRELVNEPVWLNKGKQEAKKVRECGPDDGEP